MNQILMTENKKKKQRGNSGPIEIKQIVRFFAIVIIIFGIALIGEGSYAIYKEADDKKPENIPVVTIGRVNDKAILYVSHNTEISKIIYSWNDGESTEIPEGSTTAQEEILLPNENSTLNITIEDFKGKQIKYQKQYYLEGMDLIKPIIDVNVSDGSSKMVITAEDETEIAYLSYQWEGEEEIKIQADTPGQTKIEKELKLTAGTRKINIIAEDANGNVEQIEKTIAASTSKPNVWIEQNGGEIIIKAQDEDGVRDIEATVNGKKYAAKDLNLKDVKVGPIKLQQGSNTISVIVTNINEGTRKAATEINY